MRSVTRWLAAVTVAAGLWVVATEARAERATCEDILSALAAGKTATEVAEDAQTTQARISACQRIAAHREQLAEERDHTANARLVRQADRPW